MSFQPDERQEGETEGMHVVRRGVFLPEPG